jgi:Glycosyl hydrolases family 28
MNPLKRACLIAPLAFTLILLPSFAASSTPQSSPIIYPAPPGEPLSSDFTVKADDLNVPVYLARVVALSPEDREKLRGSWPLSATTQTSFASFDFAGPTQISVTTPRLIQSAKILPTSLGLTPTITSPTQLRFTISTPTQLTIEINGDWLHSLHLFADPIDADAPSPTDPNVIYFPPGIHEIPPLQIGSNKTVYIAGGAVLYGQPGKRVGPALLNLIGSNITLRGRGIIDGSHMPRPNPGILFAQGQNITIEGVVLRDSPSWTCHIARSDDLAVSNLKVFGWRGNSDGIDICNSQNVAVSDSFLRTFDDLVVIKTNDPTAGPSQNISVKRCVLWNEFAHALSLGAELRTPLQNITFSDCDIIHDKGREWDLRVYNCDSAPVSNILFSNIRIEESRRLFSLWIGKAVWSKQSDRGHIDGITFSNITSVIPTRPNSAPAELIGFDPDHAIHNVRFNRVTIGGQPLRFQDIHQNPYVQGITVTPK